MQIVVTPPLFFSTYHIGIDEATEEIMIEETTEEMIEEMIEEVIEEMTKEVIEEMTEETTEDLPVPTGERIFIREDTKRTYKKSYFAKSYPILPTSDLDLKDLSALPADLHHRHMMPARCMGGGVKRRKFRWRIFA